MRRGLVCLLFLAVPLARAEDGDEAKAHLDKECARITAVLEGYLGRKFEGPVAVEQRTRNQMGAFARRGAKEVTPQGRLDIAARLAVRLKQVPKGYDLLGKQIELLEERALGLYDPERDTFYVAKDASQAGAWWFTTTVAHELIHAYRDVDKDYWQRTRDAVHVDADWATAVRFLVEGDAELLGNAIGDAALAGGEPEDFIGRSASRARASLRRLPALMQAPEYAEFPPLLREFLVAPYVIGSVFALAVYERGGTKALDAAYDRPPRSTEQVLHPGKYHGTTRDEPTVFAGGDPTRALGTGWKLLAANVMGEFEMRVQLGLLGRETAERAADGWDGARYFFCEGSGAREFIGMVTTWDTEQDAGEFAAAWLGWAALRDGAEAPAPPAGRRVETLDGLVVVRQAGKDVLVADGVPEGSVAGVLAALASAKRAERRPDASPPK